MTNLSLIVTSMQLTGILLQSCSEDLANLTEQYLDQLYPGEITAFLNKQSNIENSWLGKPGTRRSRQVKYIRVKDLLPIVQPSLDAGVERAAARIVANMEAHV